MDVKIPIDRFFHGELSADGFAGSVELHKALAMALDAIATGSKVTRVLVSATLPASTPGVEALRMGLIKDVEKVCDDCAQVIRCTWLVGGVVAVDLFPPAKDIRAETCSRSGHGGDR